MKKLLFLLLLISARAAFPQCSATLRHFPAEPWSSQEVELLIEGQCSSEQPWNRRIDVEPGRITIKYQHGAGPAISVPWNERVRLGKLPPGTYEVVVNTSGQRVATTSFHVKAEPRLLPDFGLSATEVLIRGAATEVCRATASCTPVVRFGTIASPAVRIAGTDIVAVVPQQPEGQTVDVTVTAGVNTLTLTAAFRYEAGDIATDFERVLFPVRYEARGAAGSDWVTQNIVKNDGPLAISTSGTASLAPGARAALQNAPVSSGIFLYVPRGLQRFLTYSSHALDRSRGTTDLGTELRVVRPREAKTKLVFVAVPFDERYRLHLRVYDFEDRANTLRLRIGMPDAPVEVPLTLVPPPRCGDLVPCAAMEPSFAAIDLDGLVSELGREYRIEVIGDNAQRLWGFITVTNQETQHVTTVTPQ